MTIIFNLVIKYNYVAKQNYNQNERNNDKYSKTKYSIN